MAQQARNFCLEHGQGPERPTILLRDYDATFVPEFGAVLQAEGVEVKRVGTRGPNLDAYAERWVQSAKRECLDHFVVFGEGHLRHLIAEYAGYYSRHRPHQGVGNRPPAGDPGAAPAGGPVVCAERLGGLLKHFHRAA